MSLIVTDTRFHPEDWPHGFVAPGQEGAVPGDTGPGVDIASGDDPARLNGGLNAIGLIRIRFAQFNEACGFDLARRLRAMGYLGRLRALGNVLAQHYTLARCAGFDEVEISLDLARRQPEEHWHFRGNWRHAEFHSMMVAP